MEKKKRAKTKFYSHTMFLRLTDEEYKFVQLIKDRETATRRKFVIDAIKEKVEREKIL